MNRLKRNVLSSRRKFTVESNIDRVIQFYRAIMANAAQKETI